jgi:hypothetical protein
MKCSKATQKGNKKMNDQPDLFKSLASLTAKVEQMKNEKKTATTKQPEAEEVENIPSQNSTIVYKQLELFPEDKRQACNAMIRGALFSAIQGGNRKMLNKETLPTQKGIEIKFSGLQLNQDDNDTYMQLAYITAQSKKSPDEFIKIPANAILKGLGRGTSGKEHAQLKSEIDHLFTASMFIRANGYYMRGRLIDVTFEDETIPVTKRYIIFRLNKETLPFFQDDNFTLIDWNKRLKLGQKGLAKWLQLYFDSNTNQYPVSVEWLREHSRSETKELWKFRQNLKKALDALVEVGFITAWRIDAGDLVHIEKLHTRSQQRHINSTSKPVLPAPTQASLAIMQELNSRTIEQFRRLYPNKCPHTCNADFASWLEGKDAPQNYDGAFLGFAKKWAFKR